MNTTDKVKISGAFGIPNRNPDLITLNFSLSGFLFMPKIGTYRDFIFQLKNQLYQKYRTFSQFSVCLYSI